MPLSDDKILRLARANLARLAADVRDRGMKLQFTAIDTASTAVGITQAGLEPYLRQRFPQRKDLHVNNVEVLAGGYSKRTIFFSIEDANGRRNGTDRVDVV